MSLEVVEGTQSQNEGEEIAWIVDVTKWTTNPTSPTVTNIYDLTTGRDVIARVMPTNSPTVSGNLITLSILKLLNAGRTYHIFVKWTDGSEKKETDFNVECKDRKQ